MFIRDKCKVHFLIIVKLSGLLYANNAKIVAINMSVIEVSPHKKGNPSLTDVFAISGCLLVIAANNPQSVETRGNIASKLHKELRAGLEANGCGHLPIRVDHTFLISHYVKQVGGILSRNIEARCHFYRRY